MRAVFQPGAPLLTLFAAICASMAASALSEGPAEAFASAALAWPAAFASVALAWPAALASVAFVWAALFAASSARASVKLEAIRVSVAAATRETRFIEGLPP